MLHRLLGALGGGLALLAMGMAQETRPLQSEDALWMIRPASPGAAKSRMAAEPARFQTFQLNEDAFAALAAEARTKRGQRLAAAPLRMSLPMPDGSFTRITVEEDSILSPELEAKYPEFRTYVGWGVDDPSMTVRLDRTTAGFHGQMITSEGTVLVNPLDAAGGLYISFWKHDVPKGEFSCQVEDGDVAAIQVFNKGKNAAESVRMAVSSGPNRRTYRLAMIHTKEYTDFFGGATNAAAQVTTTVNRVNGIYERDLTVRLNLTNIIDAKPIDPYPFTGAGISGTRLDEAHAAIVAAIGVGAFDVGHVVSAAGGGGLAQRPSVCNDGSKGRGGTALNNPSGDVFDVDYVAHEIGHQFNAPHTFAGSGGNCNAANFAAEAGYEPGSGTTIMAYAGICSPVNVQSNSNDYFHTHSVDTITTFRDAGGSCGVQSSTGNNPPDVDAGSNWTIPQNTPFRLTATGSDPDGDALTYNWEQYDLQPTQLNINSNNATGPLFRSRPSTASPTRTLPRFEDILSGNSPWEVLPTVNRDLNFRVTARDGRGGTRFDAMTVSVSGPGFGFTNTGAQECGLPSALTWTTGQAGLSNSLRLSYSTNDGGSFSTLLANTPNDGSEQVNLPKTLTTNARLQLEALDNIFFNVSPRFTVRDTLAPTVTPPANVAVECNCNTPPGATGVVIGTATATDICDNTLNITSNAPPGGFYPLGETTVTWSATDDSSNTGTAQQKVKVSDTTPPSLSFTLSPTVIWPPDHKLVKITATITVADTCDPNPTIKLLSVTANEPVNTTGDGNTQPDIVASIGVDSREIWVRAERRGNGTGRIYTITYEASDASGNKTVKSATVSVPRDQS